MLARYRTLMTPRGPLLDSALADRATLAPIWQHSHQPPTTQMLDFGATTVTGWLTPKDSKVAFSDPIITSTYWIDRETRKILRQDVTQRRSRVRFRSVPLS
jgi:hypothetical protein